jgi:hypothetical protein
LKNERQSLIHLKEAESLAKSNGQVVNKLGIYKLYADYHERKKDFQAALMYRNKYVALKDSVYSGELIKSLTELQIDYAERENIKKIKAKDQVLLLKEELIQKQKLQTFLVGSIAVLLLLLTVVFYKFYRNKLLINIKLDQKVKERTEELRQNNSSLVLMNELRQSVLQKIGRESQGIISGIKGLCHMAQLDVVDERIKEYFQKVDIGTDQLAYLLSRMEANEV